MKPLSFVRWEMCLFELKDLLGGLLLSSPVRLHLILTDDGAGRRLLADFPLQLLYDRLQGFQLSGGGLSLDLQCLSQSCALSGLHTSKRSFTIMFPLTSSQIPAACTHLIVGLQLQLHQLDLHALVELSEPLH